MVPGIAWFCIGVGRGFVCSATFLCLSSKGFGTGDNPGDSTGDDATGDGGIAAPFLVVSA